jgi:hypothetical protein
MSRPKSRDVGAGVLTRYRNGACTFTCRHDGCRAWWEPRSWRAGLRQARTHAADHDATEARYAGTPWGIPAHELPRASRRRRPLPRVALVGVVLVLAVIAFVVTLAGAASRAAPQSPAPSIGIVTTTTAAPNSPAADPATTGYRPTVAGPPATDAQGQWIPEPDPPTSTTSSAGGDR